MKRRQISAEMSMVSGVTVLLRIVSPLPLFCYPSGTWSDGLCVISASSGLHFSAVDATRGSKMAKKGKMVALGAAGGTA